MPRDSKYPELTGITGGERFKMVDESKQTRNLPYSVLFDHLSASFATTSTIIDLQAQVNELKSSNFEGNAVPTDDPAVFGNDDRDILYDGAWVNAYESGTYTDFLDENAEPLFVEEGAAYFFTYVAAESYWTQTFIDSETGDQSLFLGLATTEVTPIAAPEEGNWYLAQDIAIYNKFGGLRTQRGYLSTFEYNGVDWLLVEKPTTSPNFQKYADTSTNPTTKPKWGDFYIPTEYGEYYKFKDSQGNSIGHIDINNKNVRIRYNGAYWSVIEGELLIDNIGRPQTSTTTLGTTNRFKGKLKTNGKIVISEEFDFGGATVDFTDYPNMEIEVEKGGLLKNVTLVCNDTWFTPKSYQVFDLDVVFEGTPQAKYVRPEMWGAIGYETEELSRIGVDSFYSMQAALDFVSGNLLTFKGMNKYYRSSLMLHAYDCMIVGCKMKIVSTDGTAKRMLYIAKNIDRSDSLYSGFLSGDPLAEDQLLTDDAIHKEMFVKVQDSTMYKSGDIVLVSSNQNYTDGSYESSGGLTRGELKEVETSIDNVITFTSPIFEIGYTTEHSAKIRKLSDTVTINVTDVEFIGEYDNVPDAGTWLGASTGNAILSAYTYNAHYENIKIKNCISSGITQVYAYNPKIINYINIGCIGGNDAGGYAHELIGACTSPYTDNYIGLSARHALDITDVSFTDGRVWDASFSNCLFTGNELYSGSIVGFHAGIGSVKFLNVHVIGSESGTINNSKTENWHAGDTRLYADETIGKKRYYLSLIGDEVSPNNESIYSTNAWLLISSPNAYRDIEYDPLKNDYEFNDKISYKGELFWYNSRTSVAGTDPYDTDFWRDVRGTEDGTCYTFRGASRKIEMYNCSGVGTNHGFIFEGCDELIIDGFYAKDVRALFTDAKFDRHTLRNITTYQSGLFAWSSSVVGSAGTRELIFSNCIFNGLEYGKYADTYIANCFSKLIFENCKYIDSVVTGWDYHTEGHCPKFRLFGGNNTFKGFEFLNCTFVNQGYLSPYVHGNNTDSSYYVKLKGCSYSNERHIRYTHGFACSRPVNIIIKDCELDLTHIALENESTLIDTAYSVTGDSTFAIYNSDIKVDKITHTAASITKMLLANSSIVASNNNVTADITIYKGDIDVPIEIEGEYSDPNNYVDGKLNAYYKDYSNTGTWKKTSNIGTLTGWVLQPKDNYTATAAPTVNDDASLGYGVGSKWYDTVLLKAYELFNNTTGAAVWVPLN